MPGYHKKKNKQKKAHHNGEPHDHPHKKKEDLKKRLAKISKKVPQDPTLKHQRHMMLHHGRPMVNYDKELIDKTVLKNQKKGKKVPQNKIRETPTKENNYQTHMDSKGAFEQRALKEKVKKAELTDVTKEHKQKQKKKDKLIHQARGTGVIPTYSKSKVKKTPPQGPSGGTADNPDDIIKDAEAVARKNDTYIGKLKEKIASKKKEQERRILKETEEEEEIKHQKISQEHDHSITFKGYKGESYKRASLISNTGKYAKYWLLNAKQTNGNGWGVSQQSIAKNIHKFVGKPLVVTAKSWIPNSEYGDAYEHPYLPTNDINKVFDHQEKFRVGSIVDIIEKDGDYFANIEINQKFAHMVMPPFCSPAIFQNNPSEPEGQISDWEALHLAALHEDPAYGSRIALLRGTCVGTQDQCTVQFKSAKQQAKMVCIKGLKGRIARVKKNEKTRVKKASDDWSSTTDTDFFRKPFKARKLSFDMTGLDYMDSLHDKASWNAGQKAMERFKNELSHPFSRKYAYDVLDNHAYNSGLVIDNNYPDLEGYIDENDSKSLQNLLEGHNKDILEHANYGAEEAFGFVEDEPLPPTSEGEALGRKLFEPFKKMKDDEYAKIPDRRGDMLRTKGILKDYTNDVSGGIMKDFGTHRRNQLGAKKSPMDESMKRVIERLKDKNLQEKMNKDLLEPRVDLTKKEIDENIAIRKQQIWDDEYKNKHKLPKEKYFENKEKYSKLKQRIAAIEQQKLAVSYKRKIDEVMKSFNTWEYKNEKTPKGLKKKDDRFEPLFTKHKGGIRGVRHLGNKFQYSGHYKGTGTTISKGAKDKFIPHIIMEKTPKGIIIDNYGYDSGSTYRYFNKAGISTERKGDKMYIGGKPYNFEQGGKMLIPYKNITAPLAPKKRYVGHVRPRQHEMSQQTRLDATGDIKGVPEDPTRIQPKDQRLINKITGVKSKVPRRKILGTESHHLFEYGKYPQMDKLEHAGIGVSHRTHQEIMNPRKFTAKLKQRLSKISGMPKDNKWVYDSIDDPYMSTEIAEHRELEYPVIKWNKGEEYAVLSNKSGKPLQDNKFSTKNPPKNIEYLQQFNNPEDALDYSEYKHTKEYGSHLFENDEHFKGLEKKFKHIKDPNTQYQ